MVTPGPQAEPPIDGEYGPEPPAPGEGGEQNPEPPIVEGPAPVQPYNVMDEIHREEYR